MAEQQTLPTVRQHADALIDDLIAKGNIAPDPAAAGRAAGIPTFSKGTATLDENTGKPISESPEVPEFTAGQVQSPEQVQTPEEAIAAHKERLAAAKRDPETGKFVSERGQDENQPAEQPAQAAGSEAAEAAAEAIADRFAEYEEFEYEDPDLEVPIPVRVPKQYAQSAKRGYGRRAALDRQMSYYKNADPVFREMVEDGRLNQILPLIQRAMADQQYGEYVWQGYQRAQQGLPLIEQAKMEAAQAAAPPQQYAQTPDMNALAQEDPFFYERIAPVLQQYEKRFETLQQKLDRQEQERQAAIQQQQAQQQQNVQLANEMALAHRDLAAAYPQRFSGDLQRDNQIWQRTVQYARDSGYVATYGVRSGLIFAGQQIEQLEQERQAATASPAAQLLAQAETKHMDLARQEAAAASKTVGRGASTGKPPAPRPPAPPSPRRADGTLKTTSEFLLENQAWLAATGGQRG